VNLVDHSRIIEEMFFGYRIEIATNTLIGHSRIKNLVAIGLISVPKAVV